MSGTSHPSTREVSDACGNCRYWARATTAFEGDLRVEDWSKPLPFGRCRSYPAWVENRESDWCGEFESLAALTQGTD